MRPVFANSATLSIPEWLVLAKGRLRTIKLGVRFGVWVHPRHGPIVIDTGYGPEVTTGHRSLALRLYASLLRPRLETQPEDVLADLGFRADDVKYVFVTHFHADHISGLRRFPKARFIAAGWPKISTTTHWQRLRHGLFTELLPDDFEARLIAIEDLPVADLPFGHGHDLFGDASLLALDLPGHATGHCGLVWPQHKLIYAADAQWLGQAIAEDRPPRGPARWVYDDEVAMTDSMALLRRAALAEYEIVLCHDPVS
jgi:glyoxylase-like metal-dependent hydrolase (beta-lactamase superfamily II)